MIEPKKYLLTVRFGKRHIHGLHIYNMNEAVTAKKRLVAVGAKSSDIRIDTYESVFGGAYGESKIIECAV